MSQTFDVLSPDGFPITHEPFASEEAAREYIPRWIERYQQQGYYSTARRERIALEDLPLCLKIIPVEN
jgi:hypothetical protein